MMGNSYGQYGYPQYPTMSSPNQQIMQNYADRLNQYQNQIQQMQPQYQQSIQPQAQQATSNIDWLIVTDEEQAKNMIVQPNQTMWTRDSREPKLYVKSVSSTGIAEFHSFTLVENQEIKQEQIQQPQPREIDLSGYVSIDVFNQEMQKLNDKVMEYESKLAELTKVNKTTTTTSTRKEVSK